MADTQLQPRLLLPFLRPFYDWAAPLSWLLIRCVIGLDLAIHGWEKVVRLPSIVDALMQNTFPVGMLRIIILVLLEFVGGICIAVGLFTRFFAAAAAIELAIITFGVFWPAGFSWAAHGYEYILWWGLITFAIALRGGGQYSLDRRLGIEL
jgi:putative oxidoreductase